MKKIFYFLFFTYSICLSQITNIPDAQFEQALIDQNIDSDGVLNGQVFTNDINNLNSLYLGTYFINDLTGLEDFIQLKNLSIDILYLPFSTDQILNLSANTNLETLTMNGGDDAFNHFVTKINLSTNLNLTQVHTTGIWDLRQLDLKTGSTDVSNLSINISVAPNDLTDSDNYEVLNNNLFCIKVTDEVAATAGTGVYSTWTIIADNNPYYFSETCTLNIDRFNNTDLVVYPNPASDLVNIKAKNFLIDSFKIYNVHGQLVKQNNFTRNFIEISDLEKGLYIIHLEGKIGVIKKKFLKK